MVGCDRVAWETVAGVTPIAPAVNDLPGRRVTRRNTVPR